MDLLHLAIGAAHKIDARTRPTAAEVDEPQAPKLRRLSRISTPASRAPRRPAGRGAARNLELALLAAALNRLPAGVRVAPATPSARPARPPTRRRPHWWVSRLGRFAAVVTVAFSPRVVTPPVGLNRRSVDPADRLRCAAWAC